MVKPKASTHHLAQMNVARVLRHRERLRALVNQARDKPCADCGGVFPVVCMDFDHPGDNKAGNVATMMQRTSAIAKLVAEIEKCEVVCSNCHRIRTVKRLARQPVSIEHRRFDRYLMMMGGEPVVAWRSIT